MRCRGHFGSVKGTQKANSMRNLKVDDPTLFRGHQYAEYVQSGIEEGRLGGITVNPRRNSGFATKKCGLAKTVKANRQRCLDDLHK